MTVKNKISLQLKIDYVKTVVNFTKISKQKGRQLYYII